MAYQFFKAHQPKQTSSPPLSPPQYNNNRPPIHPAPLVLPQAASDSKPKPPTSKDATFHPPSYPHPIPAGYQTPHPHITIETVGTAHIPSLTRITGLLLPIRYPNSFYTATITDPVISSVSRVAIYHDHPVATVPASSSPSSPSLRSAGTDKVIGGIRCRLEKFPQVTSELLKSPDQTEPTNLYIQTLHLLSPYRGCGVASSLFNSLLFSEPPSKEKSGYRVSELVEHYNIRTVTAHVHEANEEGLKWYLARGFQVEDGVVENYYRRLKPAGARIVKFVIQRTEDEGPDNNKDQTKQNGPSGAHEDDDWEKVEAEDAEEHDERARCITESKILESEDGGSRKRKADDEPQQ